MPGACDGALVIDPLPADAPVLLVDDSPLPAGLDSRLREQLTFIVEIDRLKTVLRASPLAAADRRENDAEHSWHLAMMVPLLAEYADRPIDVGHTVQLVLVHDLVEVYAGDTPLYDAAARAGQEAREQAAADRLFALLPTDQGTRLRALWDEFEARATPEAMFAKALDRLQPVLLNWMAAGGTWRTYGATAAEVLHRTSAIGEASATLGTALRTIVTEAEQRGWTRTP